MVPRFRPRRRRPPTSLNGSDSKTCRSKRYKTKWPRSLPPVFRVLARENTDALDMLTALAAKMLKATRIRVRRNPDKKPRK